MLTLSTESEGRNQADNYFYDFNVVGMSRAVGDDYFIQDDLGSPMSVINQRGNLEETYAYDEFGQEYGNIIDARNRFQPFGYTGYQREAVGDTYFAQARRYDASIGRFVSEDKVDTIIDSCCLFNKYAYCINNPYSYVDLNGLWPKFIEDHKEAIGIGITVAGVVASVAITVACPIGGPVVAGMVAGAISGSASYVGDKIYNDEKVTFAGFAISAVTGAASGALGAKFSVAGKVASSVKGAVVKSVGVGSLTTAAIEGGGKALLNVSEHKKWYEDVASTAVIAGLSAGLVELGSVKFKGDVDVDDMTKNLKNEVNAMKDAAYSKWLPKIKNGTRNAKSNLQKNLKEIKAFKEINEEGIQVIKKAFMKFDAAVGMTAGVTEIFADKGGDLLCLL